ncbi:DUF5686 family protein [Nonlabens sp.]|uniref:DUF5686 family protein n=1 Tax=Nonlabens sp. TaxID=1888209 RepID=UPI003F6A082E
MKLLFGILLTLSCATVLAQKSSAREADLLMTKVLISTKKNDPTHKLNSYKYDSYENLKVSGDPEALTGPGYKKTELRKTLKKTRVFFAEKTSRHIYDYKEGYKEIITGANMPGFEEPVYPIYNIDFQSENVYEDRYIIFDQEFISPLNKKSMTLYNFQIEKDTTVAGRAVSKLNFTPKDSQVPQLFSGNLYIDLETYGVAKAVFEKSGKLNIDAYHDFIYNEAFSLWLNSSRKLYVRQEKTRKEFELFGGRLEVGIEKKTDDDKNAAEELYLIIEALNSNFQANQEIEYGRRGLKIEVQDSSIHLKEEYWEKYRGEDAFSTTELAQFMDLDSIVSASKITRKLEILDKFKVGYFPISFIDVDLKYLVKYNDYEAFRLGMGGQTNEKLSENFRINGYLAYGTKDAVFKHKIGIGFRINKEKNTWLNIYKQDDINEFAAESFLTDARVYSLFEPRLINIPTFYLYEQYGMSLQQRLFPSVISEVSLTRKRINQTTSYQYISDQGDSFSEYVLAEATLGVRWSPESDFMRTPRGFQEISRGYPILSGQITKGFRGVTESNFNYFKVSGKAQYVLSRPDQSGTEFLLEGHYSTGEVPLTHLFHAYPNAPNKDEVLQRFSVAGTRSFETMYFNEFFSDRIIIGQVRHRLAPFNIFSFLKPEMVLITKAAWGNLDNIDRHQNVSFNTLEKGYFESGFELNKLIFGFGLSASYRYGPYHLPDFEDNLALKFTFYLEL